MSNDEATVLKMIQELTKTQHQINKQFNVRLESLEKQISELEGKQNA
ncbi:MAG: hypothetical protein ACFFC7_33160 [Candidatus Hermodarchaeota archaeon]